MNVLYIDDLQFKVSDLINSLKSGESIELLSHNDDKPIGLFVPMNIVKSNKRK